jgi:hypothetical protein
MVLDEGLLTEKTGTQEGDEVEWRHEIKYRGCLTVKLKPPVEQSYFVHSDGETAFWKFWNLSMLALTTYNFCAVMTTALVISWCRGARHCNRLAQGKTWLDGQSKLDYFHLFASSEENDMAHIANGIRFWVLLIFAAQLAEKIQIAAMSNNGASSLWTEDQGFISDLFNGKIISGVSWDSENGRFKIHSKTFPEAGFVYCMANQLKYSMRLVFFWNWICSVILVIGLVKRSDFDIKEIRDAHKLGALLASCVTGYITSSDFYFMTPLQKPREFKDHVNAICTDLLFGWLFIIAEALNLVVGAILHVVCVVVVTAWLAMIIVYLLLSCVWTILCCRCSTAEAVETDDISHVEHVEWMTAKFRRCCGGPCARCVCGCGLVLVVLLGVLVVFGDARFSSVPAPTPQTPRPPTLLPTLPPTPALPTPPTLPPTPAGTVAVSSWLELTDKIRSCANKCSFELLPGFSSGSAGMFKAIYVGAMHAQDISIYGNGHAVIDAHGKRAREWTQYFYPPVS